MLFRKKDEDKTIVNTAPVDVDDANRDIAAEVDAMMKKFDLESNTRIWEGWQKWVVMTISACFAAYCIWSTLFSVAGIEERLTAFLGCIIILGYLNYPRSKKHVNVNELPWYDIVLMVAGAGAFFYYCFEYKNLVMVLTSASKMNFWFTAVGVVGVVSLMELCRRCVGLPILCVVGALLVYTFSIGLPIERVIYTLFYGTSGVMGTPINVCAKFIVVFTIFGAFLERTGISNFFINLANCVAGASSGGPAKVAVISSALCGMVSGSSVGNTVTTGSVTIPMMKKTGYKPEFSAAVEASASTGGQIMPPIMGAAAFLMAEYMGITYAQVALMAILPAFLYFGGIFMSVHLEARRLGLKGIPREELPKFGNLIKKIYLLAPLVLLVWLVSTNARTMQTSASLAIVATIVVSLFDKENRITPKKFFEAMEAGGRGVITVAVACAMAGIIAGCITVTGLASKLITAVVAISGNNLMIALFLTMICCIVLGMGVPTTANYCIMAATCAPILTRMGVPPLAAHFFVFYFGIVADLTPPVALAAYAGAAIAQANPMKTAVTATKLAIGAFIVPYVFALNPALLMIDISGPLEVITIVVTSLVGIFAVSASLEGYLIRRMPWYQRIISVAGGLLLIYPGMVTDIIGIGLVAVTIVLQLITKKRALA